MKKKIYDLKYSEEMNLMKEIIEKPYCRQYFMLTSFVVGIAILSIFLFIFCVAFHLINGNQINYLILLITILFIFVLLIMSLFAKIKWMDFVKKYFDENNK